MKHIRGLSGVALVSFLSVNSGVAMGKGVEQVPNPALSTQTQPVIIAQFNPNRNPSELTIEPGRRSPEQMKILMEYYDGLRRSGQTLPEPEWIQQERIREDERRRQEATEQQRLEAERRPQNFESLSPQEKEADLTE